MTKYFLKLPEFYLILLTLLAGYQPPFYFNPIFLVVIGVLVLQIVFKNRISGLLIGSLLFLGNLYFLGAVYSEYTEFKVFSTKAQQLLAVGLGLVIINFLMSFTIFIKYLRSKGGPSVILK